MSEDYNENASPEAERAPTTKSVDLFNEIDRRDVLKAGVATSALAAGAATSGNAFAMGGSNLAGRTFGQNPIRRATRAFNIRNSNALRQFRRFRQMTGNFQVATNNGDEALYDDRRGSFSKSLQHNNLGEVVPASYNSYLRALRSRRPADFDAIEVGNATAPDRFGLVAPQAAFSFDQSAVDSNGYRMPDAPAFASAETAIEMGELYWHAMVRDVPFTQYDSNPIVGAAVDDLNNNFSATSFLTDGAPLTSGNVFRGTFEGADVGPFVSQFLYQPFMFGRSRIVQRYIRPNQGVGNNFMTSYDEWLAIQNGAAPTGQTDFSANQNRFIATSRDLAEWVHVDFPVQGPLYAFLILLGYAGDDPSFLDPNLPYNRLNFGIGTQDPFTSWGGGGLPHLVLQAPRIGLLGAWFQKWAVHRRLRPEVYAGRINNQLRGRANYDLNSEILNSDALAQIIAAAPSSDDAGLLPMAYPEGSPVHPAYPGGHSTFAAAGATICKALFNEDAVIPNPVRANSAGSGLQNINDTLTVGGELNKLVGNITHGRDGAGMHWRTDGLGNFIGENVAITLLADYSRTYNDDFDGFQLTRFNGERIRIVDGNILAN